MRVEIVGQWETRSSESIEAAGPESSHVKVDRTEAEISRNQLQSCADEEEFPPGAAAWPGVHFGIHQAFPPSLHLSFPLGPSPPGQQSPLFTPYFFIPSFPFFLIAPPK